VLPITGFDNINSGDPAAVCTVVEPGCTQPVTVITSAVPELCGVVCAATTALNAAATAVTVAMFRFIRSPFAPLACKRRDLSG
jgi:hypothetical protein